MLQRNSSASVTCNEIWWKKCYFNKEFENILDNLLAPVAHFLTISIYLKNKNCNAFLLKKVKWLFEQVVIK